MRTTINIQDDLMDRLLSGTKAKTVPSRVLWSCHACSAGVGVRSDWDVCESRSSEASGAARSKAVRILRK
ncbi:hypothetical protein LCGC14_2781290, partial [marine sediment metagenome]